MKNEFVSSRFERSVGAQHVTGDQWRNNSRKNEKGAVQEKAKAQSRKQNLNEQ